MTNGFALPKYRMMIVYDVLPDKYEIYYRYVLGEFVPSLRDMGLPMLYAWHIPYGNYPARLLEFRCEDTGTIRQILTSSRWQHLENRLKSYTTHYHRKLIYYEERFQL